MMIGARMRAVMRERRGTVQGLVARAKARARATRASQGQCRVTARANAGSVRQGQGSAFVRMHFVDD